MSAYRRRFSINAGLAFTLVLLTCIGWLCWRNMRAMAESDRWEDHTYLVIRELGELLSAIKDVETGQRGFMITGNPAYLKPYQDAQDQADRHMATLRQLTRDNPNQQQRLNNLESAMRERMAILKQSIDLRSSQGEQAAYQVAASGRGKELMDQIRGGVAQAQAEADRLLRERAVAKEANTHKTVLTLLFGGVFSFVILILVFTLLKRELTRRFAAEENLRLNRDRLAELVEERTMELKEANRHLQKEVRERTQSEEAARRSEEKYRIIIESATDYAIFTLDSQWRVTSWNRGAQQILGYAEAEIQGEGMEVIFTGEDRRQGVPEADIRDVQALGRTKNERWYRRKDGRRFWGIGIMVAQHDNRGNVLGYLKILQDITERKQAEEELERRVAERTAELKASYQALEALNAKLAVSNRELQDFAFVASHDLQEPLRKVMAFGDILIGEYGGVLDDAGVDYLRRMQAAANRMQALIGDLLQFSRVTSKAQPFTTVNLNQVAEGVLSDLEVRIRESGGRVEAGELPTIEADPLQMRQLLQNLVGNAIKFARPEAPPLVRIFAETPAAAEAGKEGADEHPITLYVADNGIGFEEKYLDRIFTVFQRLHGRGVYEGTGIGLAICRKIVERHGGSITARSRPGEGSTFIVTLPARQTSGRSANGA